MDDEDLQEFVFLFAALNFFWTYVDNYFICVVDMLVKQNKCNACDFALILNSSITDD